LRCLFFGGDVSYDRTAKKLYDDYQRKLCSGIYESPHGVIERKEFEEYSKEYSYRTNCKLTGKFRSRKYF
jgi:hypothetical protein